MNDIVNSFGFGCWPAEEALWHPKESIFWRPEESLFWGPATQSERMNNIVHLIMLIRCGGLGPRGIKSARIKVGHAEESRRAREPHYAETLQGESAIGPALCSLARIPPPGVANLRSSH